ncbi:MAG: 3-ketoacyl-ACP reductase [Lentisphaeria bacterium]|nr:3-ketoacyl-ACP reductase [Lentisphaeria bacterium]NQZ68783.1 3-ketoacyl-ACP reductase [Lentisphaeria bacterium]
MSKKVVLITGGSRGIGLGIAKCLAADNCDLVICGRREQSQVQETIDELKALGADVLYSQADISNAADRERMLKEIDAYYGRLNVLVNNAGVAPDTRADILDATEESYERVMRINSQGPYFLTQACANWFIKQREENADAAFYIVNVSSISAVVASPSRGEYCVSKAAVSMATKLWAVRLGEYNIPVYEVQPGVTKTDMTSVVTEKYDKLIFEENLCVQPRWGYPEDTGKVIAAMVRGDMPYSTGQIVNVDGGLMLQRL